MDLRHVQPQHPAVRGQETGNGRTSAPGVAMNHFFHVSARLAADVELDLGAPVSGRLDVRDGYDPPLKNNLLVYNGRVA